MSRPFSQKRRPVILATSVAALFSLGFLLGTPKAAADEYWDGTNTGGSNTANGAGGIGNWDNATTNWVDVNGANPHLYDPNDTAHFATAGGTVTLNDNVTITALQFDAGSYTIDAGSGPFTLTTNGGTTISAASGVAATINPVITGTGSITVNGSGTINLAGANTYVGGTVLNGGQINIDNSSALGDGTLTINGGTIGTNVAGTRDPITNLVSGDLVFTNPVVVQGDFSIATNVNADAGLQNITFGGTVDLTGGTRTITGLIPGGQITFSGVISNGSVTFHTATAVDSDSTSDYESFIYGGTDANTYTGLTTVAGHSILVLAKSISDGAIQGDIDVEGNGSVDYINGAAGGSQIADTATVTINSPGVTFSGIHIDGLDLRSASETIGTLNGNSSGRVALGSGTLTISVGGTYNGIIEDGDPNFEGAGGVGGNLTMAGTGTLILGGQSSYTGKTTIQSGAIQTNVDFALPSTSAVLVNAGAKLDVNSTFQQLGSLADGASGGGTVSLGNGTLEVGFDNTSTTFTGVIQDGGGNSTNTGGAFIKTGTGTMVISGANTYTGITLVLNGTLQAGANNTLPSASQLQVSGGATFDLNNFNQTVGSLSNDTIANGTGGTVNLGTAALTMGGDNSDTYFSGVIQGTGSVTKLGTGTIALAGTNTYTGGTTLTAGGISLSGSLASKVTVNNATGITTLINTGTINGGATSVDATTSAGVTIGDFGKFNGKVLLGTGINTVIVATEIPYAAIAGGAGSNDTLRLVGGGQDTLKVADFSGYETLNKDGGGMWNLVGSTSFIKGTTIDAGTLNVQGTLASNTIVNADGTLSGYGTIAGNVLNRGFVAPGTPTGVISLANIPGTLTVKGNYTQNSDGVLVVQVNGTSGSNYSRLAATGRAQLGGDVVLQSNGNTVKLKFGQKVTFLTADGGVSGKFSNVDNFLSTGTIVVPKLVYDANSVSLVGGQGSFMAMNNEFHLTYNQKAVAQMLDSAAADPRAAKIMGYLDARALKKLPGDFDKIAPEEMASVFRLGVSLSDVQSRNVQRRTADLRAGTSGFSAAGFQTTGSPNYSGGVAGPNGADDKDGKTIDTTTERRWGTFITGVGDFAHVGDSGNARGYDLNTGGVTVGADYRLTPKVAVGVTAGYAGTNANLPEDGRLLVNSGRVGVYGTYFTGGYYADAAVTGGVTNYSTRRASLEGNASGSTQGGSVDVLAATGYDWRLDALTIGPTASFQYTYVGIDGYTERGSLTPLRYAGQHQSSIRSSFGLRMAYDWKVGGVLVRPEVSLAWQHEYGDRSYSIDSALASGAGEGFSVADTPVGRDSLLFGAGVAVLWNARTSTYLYYDADLLQKEYNSQSVSGGLRLNF